jgi:hypothetical protein
MVYPPFLNMKKNLPAGLAFLFISTGVFSQTLKRYDFPALGFSQIFYADAKQINLPAQPGFSKITEYEYRFENQQKGGGVLGIMRVFELSQCYTHSDIIRMCRQYIRKFNNDTSFFRIMKEISYTNPFSWGYYAADAGHQISDVTAKTKGIRSMAAYFSHKVLVVVDITELFQENRTKEAKFDEIIEKNGAFEATGVFYNMPQLGIRLKTRGNMAGEYIEKDKQYLLKRCDMFGQSYPQILLGKLSAAPNTEWMGWLADFRTQYGFDNVMLETLEPKDSLARCTGKVYRITAKGKMSSADKYGKSKEVNVYEYIYLFTFRNQHYYLRAYVPLLYDKTFIQLWEGDYLPQEWADAYHRRVLWMLSTLEPSSSK